MKNTIEDIKLNYTRNAKETFETLLSIMDKQSGKYDDFLILKARHDLINRQFNQNIVSREDYEVELNQINIAFFDFLNNVNNKDLLSNSTLKSELLSFNDEAAAYDEIREEILKSRKIKLHCIRGSKLFKENQGLFDLLRYEPGVQKPNMFLDFKVLLLDYNNLNENEYEALKQGITINWRGLEVDRGKLAKTVDRIKSINEKYTCRVRLYNVNMFQHIKLFMFDSNCYFTFYHKLGKIAKHQEYPLFKVRSNSPLYLILERIFDTTWQNSNPITDQKE